MTQKILFFDPDIQGEENKTKQILHTVLRTPTIEFLAVFEKDSFEKALFQQHWTTVLINFQTDAVHFSDTEFAELIGIVKHTQDTSCVFIALSNNRERIVILEQYNFNIGHKQYTIDEIANMFKIPTANQAVDITLEEIRDIVCEYFDISPVEIHLRSRKRKIVRPRQVAMYLSLIFTKYSGTKIGEFYGGYDHTTPVHSRQTVQDLIDSDDIFRKKIFELTEKIKNEYYITPCVRA